MEAFTIALSVLAITMSFYTILHQRKNQKTQEALINKYGLLKAENDQLQPLKAKVRANYIRTNPGSYTIKIFNVGPAIARNVKIEFNPVDFNDIVEMGNFPYPCLEPEDSTEVYMNTHKDLPSKVGIKLQWDDDNEFNNEHTQLILL